MSERDLLDLLAQDAPVARPDLAGAVIDRARHDRRRRWAVSGACLAVALVAAVPLGLALNRSPHTVRQISPGVASSTHRPITAPPSDTSLVYAAGIKYLARQLVSGKQWRVLYVLDHTCTNVMAAFVGPCNPHPIPAGVRRELAAALAPYAPVQFVSDHAKIRDKQLQVINDGVAVMLGRVQLEGESARLPLAVQCGGLCGMGETLLLAKSKGVWTVTGTTGSLWIS